MNPEENELENLSENESNNSTNDNTLQPNETDQSVNSPSEQPVEDVPIAHEHIDAEDPVAEVHDEWAPNQEPQAKEEINIEALRPSVDDIVEPISPKLQSNESEETEGEETQEAHEIEVDYASLSKDELIAFVKGLSTESVALNTSNHQAREAKKFFGEFVNQEKAEALEKFLADGGESDDFRFKQDEHTEEFYRICNDIRDKKSQRNKQNEENQDNNLKKKEALIDKLRDLISNSETSESFNVVKELQDEWKSIGPIPKAQLTTTWANYSALLDIYYNNRSIHYELKELDRKKNLDQKLELCVQAENLNDLEDIRTAVNDLNTLHEKFKQIGPIPKTEQEPVWQRFKAASDKIYDRRRAASELFKKEMACNLKIKKELCEKVKLFESFDTDRIKEWNEETKKLLALQKEWEAVGPIPRENSRDVAKHFWASFKVFFKHKSEFFSKLDAAREDNYIQKEAILKEAQALIETENEDNKEEVARKLKEFQTSWKNIGPVPEKKKDQVIPVFRKLLDAFFNRRRNKFAEKEKNFKENLQSKIALCDEMTNMAEGDLQSIAHEEALAGFIKRWKEIGFVPMKNKDRIQETFNKAIETYISKVPDLDEKQKEVLQIETELKMMGASGGSRSLERKEEAIRKRIRDMEEEVSTINNNLGFFSKSKSANQMLQGFEDKANKLNKQIADLRKQLKTFRKLRNKAEQNKDN